MRANSSMVLSPAGLWVPERYADVLISPAVRAAQSVQAVLAGSSIAVTAGSGETVATHTVSSKKHQVFMMADSTGQLRGSRPMYFYNIPSQVHVASANTVHWDLFNADAALLVRVRQILQIPNITTAVTGIVFNWNIARTSSVGTGGSAQTAWLPDSSQTALDADITCRSKPSGGAAEDTVLLNYSISSEETNAATQLWAMLSQGGMLNLVPAILNDANSESGILLRQNEGLRCVQINSSNAGNTGWLIGFTVE